MFARETPEPGKTRVVAQCRDADFERLWRSTDNSPFRRDPNIPLTGSENAAAGKDLHNPGEIAGG